MSRRGSARRSAWIGTGIAAVAAGAGMLAAAAPAAAQTTTQIPLLDQGSVGPAVSRAQRALHIGATGRFTPTTRQAVLAFQRRDGLSVDGIVGPRPRTPRSA